MNRNLVYFIIAILIIFVLLYAEYVAHDCVGYKVCTHTVPLPEPGEPTEVYFEKLKDMVRNNYNFVAWRQALLVALILTPIVVYFVEKRMPTLSEWIVLTVVIFIGMYLSYSWLWNQFHYPNGKRLENILNEMKLTSLEANKN